MRFSRFAAVFLTATVLWGCTQNGGDVKKIIATDVTKPSTPATLSVSGATSNSIDLSWTESADNVGVAGYRVYRNGVVVATAEGTSFTDKGLTPLTKYCYQVAAIDAGENESDKSPEACAATISSIYLDISSITSKSAELSWTAVKPDSGITGYRIYKNASLIATVTGTSYSDTGLSAITKYCYQIAAVDANGNEPEKSQETCITTLSAVKSAWPKTFGGANASTSGSTVFLDKNQNIYMTGTFSGKVDFDPSDEGQDIKTSASDYERYVTKLNADSSYAWTKKLQGSVHVSSGYVRNLLLADNDSSLIISGSFSGTVDFAPDDGHDIRTSTGEEDIFIMKIMKDGSIGWVKTSGGTGHDFTSGSAMDSQGNIYLSAWTHSTSIDLDPGPGENILTNTTGSDLAYITKLNADGSYAWSKTYESPGIWVHDLIFDDFGNMLILGWYSHPSNMVDFDFGPGQDLKSGIGWVDYFITKLNADGTYAWTRTINGSDVDDKTISPSYITLDSNNNIYVTGEFSGTVDFNPGGIAGSKTAVGNQNLFLTRLNSDGSYGWTRTYPSELSVSFYGSKLFYSAEYDAIYLMGSFTGNVDFNYGAGGDSQYSMAFTGFLSKLKPDGTYVWTHQIDPRWIDIYTNQFDSFITGSFSGNLDFDSSTTSDDRQAQGQTDAFIMKNYIQL